MVWSMTLIVPVEPFLEIVHVDQEQEEMRQHSQNISGRFSRQKVSEFPLQCRANLKSEVSIWLSTHSTRDEALLSSDVAFRCRWCQGPDKKGWRASAVLLSFRFGTWQCPLNAVTGSQTSPSHWTFAPTWALTSSSLPSSVKWRENADSVIEFTTTHYTAIKSVPMRVAWWK